MLQSLCAEHDAALCIETGDPTLYNEAYDKLVSWVLGSLDIYRYELSGILYPLFLHVFLILHEKVEAMCRLRDFCKTYLTSHQLRRHFLHAPAVGFPGILLCCSAAVQQAQAHDN